MAQTLQFEAAWDKTIANQDRERIEQEFLKVKENLSREEEIQFTTLRHAINHKGELLVTVLVHNTSNTDFTFYNHNLHYQANGETIAEHIFTIPRFVIEKETSMPWTFIFPTQQILRHEIPSNGTLLINNE
ncbi:SLAP domain-containing protein [Oceanobacillus sp. Castelsardo]|uniref:SLAP domain-containing protein n=1 Tax=Oceanobacillus sp. Castelsardo TaxID=1851204 RepID=UPI000837F803|nr:SLAP domain-containing protein [Oceanobacillus sp. Castelsardo]